VETTADAILDGRLTLTQPKKGYRVAIDPVLLAAAVPAKAGERVLDAGCGVGAAGLALIRRIEGVTAVGLELQSVLAELAAANAAANRLAERFAAIAGDILDPPLALHGDPEPSFDHVMANPPYMKAGDATPPPDPVAATAVVEGRAGLRDWVVFGAAQVRDGGSLTIVHRADRLADLLAAFAHAGVGGLTVFPLWPKKPGSEGDIARDARRVIVQGRKGSTDAPRHHRGLVLHKADGGFTDEAETILRHAAGFDLS